MTQYTSGTQARDGRTVNHDPLPYRCYNWPGGLSIDSPLPGCADVYEPRPEFDVLDNPILKHARETSTFSAQSWLDAFDAFGGYVSWPDDHPLIVSTPEQIDHARHVLTRLANLAAD